MRTRPPDQPLPGTPRQVADRMRQGLLSVRSVWFPTRAELRDWETSRAELYVRWTGPDRFEVGPRLASMWAACFSPVIRGRLEAVDGGKTRLSWSPGWPGVTRAVAAAWVVVLGLWAAVMLGAEPPETGPDPARGAVFALVLAVAGAAGGWIGARWGGRALDAALPGLVALASQDPVDEDFA